MNNSNNNYTNTFIFKRKISPFERLYVASQTIFPPLAVQIAFEGVGTIEKHYLQAAIALTSESCPGTRLVLKGKNWVDSGKPPVLHEISLESFEGFNFEAIPHLWESLDAIQGPTCEVLLIHSSKEIEKTTLIFRSSHGVMDGRGTLYWAEEVFRALRGEAQLGAQSDINEIELETKLGKPIHRRKSGLNALSPLSSETFTNHLFSWKRRIIPGQQPALVAKLAAAILNFSKQNHLQFMVPVDLRRHEKTLQSTACLSLPIFLSAQKGETWEQIHNRLQKNLAEKKELAMDGSEWCLLNFPLFMIVFFIRFLLWVQKFRKKYLASAIISNIGKIKLQSFTCEGFTTQSVYSLPVHNAMIPLFFITTQCPEHLEIIVSCSHGNEIEQEVDDLLNQMTQSLT